MGVQVSVIVARPRTSNEPTTFVSVQTSPSISTRIHVSPHAPTKFWAPNLRLDSHVSGNSGHNWATLGNHDTTTKFWASITLFGRPRKVLGLGHPHVATNCHDLFGRPRTCMVAHKLPTLDAQLRGIAQPHICMGSHEIFGRSHVRVDGQDGTLLGDHTRFVGAQQRQALGVQSCGQLHAFWATTTSWMEPHVIALGYHVIVWMSTEYCGRPIDCRLGCPRSFVDSHENLWALTYNRGHPASLGLGRPTSRNMDGHHSLMGYHDAKCGWPRGWRRWVVGAQILRVESHVYSWAPIMSSWTATKRMWATTENMWSLTHLGWTTTAN